METALKLADFPFEKLSTAKMPMPLVCVCVLELIIVIGVSVEPYDRSVEIN